MQYIKLRSSACKKIKVGVFSEDSVNLCSRVHAMPTVNCVCRLSIDSKCNLGNACPGAGRRILCTCCVFSPYSSPFVVNRRQFVSQRRVHYSRSSGANQLDR